MYLIVFNLYQISTREQASIILNKLLQCLNLTIRLNVLLFLRSDQEASQSTPPNLYSDCIVKTSLFTRLPWFTTVIGAKDFLLFDSSCLSTVHGRGFTQLLLAKC